MRTHPPRLAAGPCGPLAVVCFAATLVLSCAGPDESRRDDAFPEGSPEDVTGRYLQALTGDGVVATGRFLDPEALAGLKEMFLPVLDLEAQQGQSRLRTAMFGDQATIEAVRQMDPVDFYTGLMNFIRNQLKQLDRRLSRSAVIGAVYETPDLAHVVVRAGVGSGGSTVSGVDVVTLTRRDGEWKIGLKSNIQNATRALSEALMKAQQRRSDPP